VKKKKENKPRNPFAIPAKSRKAGPMRPKKDKRKSNKKVREVDEELNP
jgi:hypothetical protein